MAHGRNNLSRGDGCAGRGGGERQNLRDQPNRRSRRCREPPERFSPRPMDRPPPPPPHRRRRVRGSRPQQLDGRAGGAFSTSAAPPEQPPPETGNGGLIQVRGGWSRGLREFCISLSFDWSVRLFISLSYSLGD